MSSLLIGCPVLCLIQKAVWGEPLLTPSGQIGEAKPMEMEVFGISSQKREFM